MISSENGKVRIVGDVAEVMSDYAVMIQQMRKAFKEKGVSDELVELLMNEANRVSRMSQDEVAQATREIEVQMMMKLFK